MIDRKELLIVLENVFKNEISQAIENCKVIREKGYKVLYNLLIFWVIRIMNY